MIQRLRAEIENVKKQVSVTSFQLQDRARALRQNVSTVDEQIRHQARDPELFCRGFVAFIIAIPRSFQ